MSWAVPVVEYLGSSGEAGPEPRGLADVCRGLVLLGTASWSEYYCGAYDGIIVDIYFVDDCETV